MAITQKGTTVTVGMNSLGWGEQTGIIMQTADESAVGETSIIRGTDNATVTVLETDPGWRRTIEAVLVSAALTAARALKKGDSITINSIIHRVEEVKIGHGLLEARVTITAIKEDSMTYTTTTTTTTTTV